MTKLKPVPGWCECGHNLRLHADNVCNTCGSNDRCSSGKQEATIAVSGLQLEDEEDV